MGSPCIGRPCILGACIGSCNRPKRGRNAARGGTLAHRPGAVRHPPHGSQDLALAIPYRPLRFGASATTAPSSIARHTFLARTPRAYTIVAIFGCTVRDEARNGRAVSGLSPQHPAMMAPVQPPSSSPTRSSPTRELRWLVSDQPEHSGIETLSLRPSCRPWSFPWARRSRR